PVWIGAAWIFLPLAVLVALIVIHANVRRNLAQAERAVDYYRTGMARLEGKWQGTGRSDFRWESESHLYAADLDLFGPGSLFERLSSARTRIGEETLARWLCHPAQPDEVRVRQEAVEELRGRLDLREDLAVLGEGVQSGIHPEELIAWATQSSDWDFRLSRWIAPVLVLLSWSALMAGLFLEAGYLPWLSALAVQIGFAVSQRHRVLEVIGQVDQPERDLELLSQVLQLLEQESFQCPLLKELSRSLQTAGKPPWRQISRLAFYMDLLDSRLNQMFGMLAALLLWTTQLAMAIEVWRRSCGTQIEGWLTALGELEALSSLSGYAYENPSDPFPSLVQEGICFQAEDIGHPLIPDADLVRNSLSLGEELQLLVVSGSNMSGKTTLLRTVGINSVLALAGAPVRARRLKLSRLTIGATVRVQDSMQEGVSRFYAEITRLRRIFEQAERGRPVLFLIDEILHGTNSHDRAIGAEAVVRSLVERGAIGLVTTHDLALAQVAESLSPQAANVHFVDHLEKGELAFDYRLHPGVVRKSNALELMRAVGLRV
ncbi:MAG: DNA mismatch repair protein MutS, partial [Acidobacteriota bacterium]